MIPTLILFGLVFGRWPWRCLAVAGVAWPLLLVAMGILGLEWSLAGAAGLAILNSLVGVAIHQGLTWAIPKEAELVTHRSFDQPTSHRGPGRGGCERMKS